jgi:hypothetical protein
VASQFAARTAGGSAGERGGAPAPLPVRGAQARPLFLCLPFMP